MLCNTFPPLKTWLHEAKFSKFFPPKSFALTMPCFCYPNSTIYAFLSKNVGTVRFPIKEEAPTFSGQSFQGN